MSHPSQKSELVKVLGFPLGHNTRAKFFNAPIAIVLATCFFMICQLDIFCDESLFLRMTFKLDGCANL